MGEEIHEDFAYRRYLFAAMVSGRAAEVEFKLVRGFVDFSYIRLLAHELTEAHAEPVVAYHSKLSTTGGTLVSHSLSSRRLLAVSGGHTSVVLLRGSNAHSSVRG